MQTIQYCIKIRAKHAIQILVTMPALAFVTLDVFTTTRFLGNPLAIVEIPTGHHVSTQQMQTIAREFNLSETVFLSESSTGSHNILEWRVRIFTTERELPFAGHPTIGAACYALGTLANNACRGRLLCSAGTITLDYNLPEARASIPHNVHVHTEAKISLPEVYEIQPALMDCACLYPHSIDVVSPVKGMNFICIELPDLESLSCIQTSGVNPKAKLDRDWDTGFIGSYFYVITSDKLLAKERMNVRTRMIGGALEDPATGSAACGLGAMLAMKLRWRRADFVIAQGVEIGRKSDIGVSITLKDSLDMVEKVELCGSSVKTMEGTVYYD